MPFSPLDIAWHSMFWAGGAEFTALGLADGAAVGTWPDEVSTRNATQGTGSKQPIHRASVAALNSKPAVEGDGVNDYLVTATFPALTQPCTLVAICVITNAAVTGEKHFVSTRDASTAAGPTFNIRDVSGTDRWAYFAGTHQSAGIVDTSAHIHVGVFNGASSSYKLDGTVISTANPGARVPIAMAMFASHADTVHAPVVVAFAALKSGTLTASELSDLEAWAASEYEIPIARSDADSGSGADSESYLASLIGDDSGGGVDAQSLALTLTDADAGIGADAEAYPVASLIGDDSGSGDDAETQGFGYFDGDFGVGTESESLATAMADADTGLGTDGETIHQQAVRRIRVSGREPATVASGSEQSS